jgi:2-polyprenyl-6-methoxyphenol hydroxylase-like FAD-dependent oxidoreductase
MVMLRGDGHDCSALLGFRSAPIDYDHRDIATQRAIVADAFAGDDAWRVPGVVAEVAGAEDFYFDAVAQIRMDSWSRGRVVLVGDAGYCASFFSGMGTTLAMVGAATLARALDDLDDPAADPTAALARYEAAMRPVVDEAQAMADGGAAILFPPTREAIEQRNATVGRRVEPA